MLEFQTKNIPKWTSWGAVWSRCVRPDTLMLGHGWYRALGVDACNTVLEVLLFAAAMNLGQSWSTILTLFGCKPFSSSDSCSFLIVFSHAHFLHTNMGRILYTDAYLGHCIWTCRRYLDALYCICNHCCKRRGQLLATIPARKCGYCKIRNHSRLHLWYALESMVYGVRRCRAGCEYCAKVIYPTPISSSVLTIHSILHVMEVQRKRKLSSTKPLYGLAPFFIASAHVAIYLYLQPVILKYHLIPFVFYVGIVNAYSVGRMIVAHLTKDNDFPMHNILIFPLSLAVVDSLGTTLGLWPSALGFGTYQIAFVFMLMGLSFGVYGSFVVSLPVKVDFDMLIGRKHDVITTICDYLDIWCLTIKHPYNAAAKSRKPNWRPMTVGSSTGFQWVLFFAVTAL